MLQALINFLLMRSTLDDALSHFNRAITKLDAVEKQEVKEIERQKQDIAEAQAKLEDATRKATIARNKAAKLRDLFGDTDEDLAPNINTLRAIG
jgi:predicted  nucleic acid-binding Zn-ribbon protein